ncbi:MAG: ExbD/TolR family protein [Steroidobacteraceae bacterium]|jgi:biopolymer transport protein ExbD
MRTWPQRTRKTVRLEIIPMIDVMMFLLVFFVLISINVLPALGLKVLLPHSASPTKIEEPKRVTVTIAPDGSIYLEGEKTTLQQLPDQLHALSLDSKIAVIIAGDEHTMLQTLVDLLDALKRGDVPAASIVTKPK